MTGPTETQAAGADGLAEPSAATSPESTAAGTGGPAVSSGWTVWRRARLPLLVLALLLLVAVVVAVAANRSIGGRLDPRGADREGGRALATLLGDRGVDVIRTVGPAAAVARTESRTVVFVPFPGVLSDEAVRRVGALAFGTVVLVAPDSDDLTAISDDVTGAGGRVAEVTEPRCANPAAGAAGAALLGGELYRTSAGDTCYPGDDEDAERGALVTGRTLGGARLTVLGTGAAFENENLAEDGNAALVINLLGGDGSADEVRWLVPEPGSAIEDDGSGSLGSILPDWVGPAVVQLLLAGLLLVLWRGRRLGPPVTEPLPVIVRAAEAVEGRARLYRRAGARDEAAGALRAGALARMVPRLGIDPGAGGNPAPEAVVAAVAARSGRPDAEVHAALYGPAPADDAGLVRLTETLDSIIRSTLDPEVPRP